MKQTFLVIIIVMVFNAGFSQPSKKRNNHDLATGKNVELSTNVYYLSINGAISDAEIGMNSVTFGTDNTTTAIQNVLDKAKNPL